MADNSLVMMALGDYRFGLSTAAYTSLSRSTEYRWEEAERLTRAPALQWVGPGGETIELQGVILPHFRGGVGQVARLRDEAGKGAPLQLVDGRGVVWGRYCLTSIRETGGNFTSDGIPRRIEFQLTLKAYGEDA